MLRAAGVYVVNDAPRLRLLRLGKQNSGHRLAQLGLQWCGTAGLNETQRWWTMWARARSCVARRTSSCGGQCQHVHTAATCARTYHRTHLLIFRRTNSLLHSLPNRVTFPCSASRLTDCPPPLSPRNSLLLTRHTLPFFPCHSRYLVLSLGVSWACLTFPSLDILARALPHVPCTTHPRNLLSVRLPKAATLATMSAPARLPNISTLSALPTAEQTKALDLLFEPSPAIHDLLCPLLKTQFPSYDALIDSSHDAFLSLADAEDKSGLHSILGSHPRLGAKKVESAQSASEQAQLAAGAAQLAALNEEYEARFPGLRYVVFVNGREKDVIMENMRQRIDRGDIAAEEREAIKVCGGSATGPEGWPANVWLGHVRYCEGPCDQAPGVKESTGIRMQLLADIKSWTVVVRAGHVLFTFNSSLGLREHFQTEKFRVSHLVLYRLLSTGEHALLHKRFGPMSTAAPRPFPVIGSSATFKCNATDPLTIVRHSRISHTSSLPMPTKTRPQPKPRRISNASHEPPSHIHR